MIETIESKIELVAYMHQDARDQQDREGVQAYQMELRNLISEREQLRKQLSPKSRASFGLLRRESAWHLFGLAAKGPAS